MTAYVITQAAKSDLFEIWSYIADDNEDAANRVERAIYDAFNFFIQAPDRKPLPIVAVLHGMRNLRRILAERS